MALAELKLNTSMFYRFPEVKFNILYDNIEQWFSNFLASGPLFRMIICHDVMGRSTIIVAPELVVFLRMQQ